MSSEGDKVFAIGPQVEPFTNSCNQTCPSPPCVNSQDYKSLTFPPHHKRSGPACSFIGPAPPNIIPPDCPMLIAPSLSTGASVSEFSQFNSLPPTIVHNSVPTNVASMASSFPVAPRRWCHKPPSFPTLPSFAGCSSQDASCMSSKEYYELRLAELPGVSRGPSLVLPHLYIGSQFDANNAETIKAHHITHVVNVSLEVPKSPYVPEANFLRVPLTDKCSEKILPHFQTAFAFLERVRESKGCALVHCLAGISRSPSLVMGYLMQMQRLTFDEALKRVRQVRPLAAPNFSFLGQLKEHERVLGLAPPPPPPSSLSNAAPASNSSASFALMPMLPRAAPGGGCSNLSASASAAQPQPQLQPAPPAALERLLCPIAESETPSPSLLLPTPPTIPPPLPRANDLPDAALKLKLKRDCLDDNSSSLQPSQPACCSFSSAMVSSCICCPTSLSEVSIPMSMSMSSSSSSAMSLPPSPPRFYGQCESASGSAAGAPPKSGCSSEPGESTLRPVRAISLGLASRRAAALVANSSSSAAEGGKPLSRQSAPNAAAASPAKGTRLKLQLGPVPAPGIGPSGSLTATVAQNVSLVGAPIASQAAIRETPASASALPSNTAPPLSLPPRDGAPTPTLQPPEQFLQVQVAVSNALVITPTAELSQLSFGCSPVPKLVPSTSSASSSTISSSSNSPPMACFQSKICKTEQAPSLFANSIRGPISCSSTSSSTSAHSSSGCCSCPPSSDANPNSDECILMEVESVSDSSPPPVPSTRSFGATTATTVPPPPPPPSQCAPTNSSRVDAICSCSARSTLRERERADCAIRADLRQTAPTSSSNIPQTRAATIRDSQSQWKQPPPPRSVKLNAAQTSASPAKTASSKSKTAAAASANGVRFVPVEEATNMDLALAAKGLVTKEASSVPTSPDPQQFAGALPLPLSTSGDSFARRPESASVLHAAGSAPDVEAAMSKLPRGAYFLSVSPAQFNKYNELFAKQNHQLLASGEDFTSHRRVGSARAGNGRAQRLPAVLAELEAEGDGRGSPSNRSRSRTAHEEWTPLLPLTESHSLDALPLVPAFS